MLSLDVQFHVLYWDYRETFKVSQYTCNSLKLDPRLDPSIDPRPCSVVPTHIQAFLVLEVRIQPALGIDPDSSTYVYILST